MVGFFILFVGCSTLDPLNESPFPECAYTLEDAATREERCLDTRPYFELGGTTTYVVDEYTTFELVVSAAPEGGIVMDEITLALSATPKWILTEILTVEDENGNECDLDEDGRVEVSRILDLEAGEEAVFVLTFDHAGLDTYDEEFLKIGYASEQTWRDESDVEYATHFRDLGHDQMSESIGISF